MADRYERGRSRDGGYGRYDSGHDTSRYPGQPSDDMYRREATSRYPGPSARSDSYYPRPSRRSESTRPGSSDRNYPRPSRRSESTRPGPSDRNYPRPSRRSESTRPGPSATDREQRNKLFTQGLHLVGDAFSIAKGALGKDKPIDTFLKSGVAVAKGAIWASDLQDHRKGKKPLPVNPETARRERTHHLVDSGLARTKGLLKLGQEYLDLDRNDKNSQDKFVRNTAAEGLRTAKWGMDVADHLGESRKKKATEASDNNRGRTLRKETRKLRPDARNAYMQKAQEAADRSGHARDANRGRSKRGDRVAPGYESTTRRGRDYPTRDDTPRSRYYGDGDPGSGRR
jgi:hypothetical protein